MDKPNTTVFCFFDEIKWSKVSRRDAAFYSELLALFMKHPNARFSCYIFRKTDLDLKKHFDGDLYRAYQSFAVMQICSNLRQTESAVIMMDDLSTPSSINLEQNIKTRVNKKKECRAVHGACRVYSSGMDLIQLNDLILGAIVYGLKIENKLISDPGRAKLDLLGRITKISKIKQFSNDHQNDKFDVWHFKPKV